MRIISENGNIIVENVQDFNLGQTLECGQCFRYDRIDADDYIIVAMKRMLHIKQQDDSLILYNTSEREYKRIWEKYFDLERDYGEIKRELVSRDDKIADAIEAQGGIRILNQEFDEVLISFIISQNQQIPRIRKIIATICERYGDKIGTYREKDYYSFPDKYRLAELTEEDFRDCKTGFRAAYLYGASKALADGTIDGSILASMNRNEAEETLKSLKGVGKKVADCTLLFGLGFKAAFPIDVWVKRVMEEIYFGRETKKEEIQKFADKAFGEYGGYAQQYLFAYAREKSLKDKNK